MSDSIRVFRMTLLTCIAAVGTAACGDDDTARPSLGTAEEVASHLALVASQAPVPRVFPAAAPPVTAHSAHSTPDVSALVVLPPLSCHTGSRDTTTASRVSPFSDSPIIASRNEYRHCLVYGGPPADVLDNSLLLHGVEEEGYADTSGGGRITYQSTGSADGTGPLEWRSRSSVNGERREAIHQVRSRVDGYFRVSGSTFETESRIVSSHEVSIRFQNGARREGAYRFGSATSPFRASAYDNAMRLSGEYAIDTERCGTGVMQVETLHDLQFDVNTSRFVAGKLQFSSDAGVASATFNADGTVTLSAADGIHTIAAPEILFSPLQGDCFASGFF